MKNIKKITPQVGLRRTFLVVLDAALILFSQARRQGYTQLPALLSALARHKRRQHQAGW